MNKKYLVLGSVGIVATLVIFFALQGQCFPSTTVTQGWFSQSGRVWTSQICEGFAVKDFMP